MRFHAFGLMTAGSFDCERKMPNARCRNTKSWLTSFSILLLSCIPMPGGSLLGAASEPTAWPNIGGRVGPYGGVLTVDDARKMAADGLTLTVLSSTAPAVLAALREGGARYIDVFFWGQISEACKAQYAVQTAAHQPLVCTLSDDAQQAIVKAAATHLDEVESDPGLVAFWILDDYPHGDVSPTLKALHDLVKRSNSRSGFQRATICGVGGSLDAKRLAHDQRFTPNHGYTENSLVNVSPQACDLVSPYFYGTAAADDPGLIDWSMKDLMPYFLQRLREKGFDTSAPLLLPVDHAFSFKSPNNPTFYVMPRPDDIATQMKAYCDAGAFSMLFFTWQSQDADQSYSNSEVIRAGVRRGHVECLKDWNRPVQKNQ